MRYRIPAAIVLAVGLALSGAAQAAGGHNGGGAAAAHAGGGGHFGGHSGGHGGRGGHFGHHGGYGYGYGYGALGLGLGLGLGAYYDDYPVYDGYGPVPHDYNDVYPDDSVPQADGIEQGAPPDVPGYWYRCDDPAGYYPYVGICPHPWQAVPAVPPPPPPPGDAH